MSKSYGILCESDTGIDEFGNAKGKRILMESIGDNLDFDKAVDQAKKIIAHGRFGRVAVVELVVVEHIF